jgi:hypothetical protein
MPLSRIEYTLVTAMGPALLNVFEPKWPYNAAKSELSPWRRGFSALFRRNTLLMS